MDTVEIFEAKIKFSEICEKIFTDKEPVLITRRGIPIVKIYPVMDENEKSDIWEVRESYLEKYGEPDDEFELPERIADTPYSPFEQ